MRVRAARRRLGLRRDARRRARRRRGGARTRAGDRRGPARRARAPAGPRGARPRPLVLGLGERPVRDLARGQARAALRRRGGAARRPADRPQRRRAATARRERKAFASTEGAACTQERIELRRRPRRVRGRRHGAAGALLPAGPRRPRRRRRAGSTCVGARPRRARAARRRRGGRAADAPVCPAGRATVVLDGEQVALQIHESIGHALELDRIQLGEAAYAGHELGARRATSGTLRYGSEHLHVTADATLPGGLGTFGWDDEGVAGDGAPGSSTAASCARRCPTASPPRPRACRLERLRARRGLRPPADRADDERLASSRAAAGSLADLIADTDDGLYLETNRSWSIDDRRLHFQFATRGRARDPRRRARPAVAQPLLRRA